MTDINNIANRDSCKYVNKREPFIGSNLFAERNTNTTKDLYVVYSYGYHFPIYIYDFGVRQWFGNEDYYSGSTSKHKAQSRPTHPIALFCSVEIMKRIAEVGYIKAAAKRLGVIA